MIHFLDKRDEESKKKNLKLKELIKELQETHKQKVNSQADQDLWNEMMKHLAKMAIKK